jgi:signal transduction histidine kinase
MAPLWETTAPFALFMFATVIAAWVAGVGPAIATGAAGILIRLYFDSPRGPGHLSITWEEAVRIALFAGFVVGSAIVLNRMRDDRRQLEASVESAQREIAERRRVEAALESAKASAEAANRLKDEFLAMVSHELRTPLNAILGWIALLRSGSLPPERSKYALEIIQKNARVQSQLVTDLLDVARSLTGQMNLEPTRLDLGTVVRNVVESSRQAAHQRQITMSLAIDNTPVTVWGDVARLQQVVGNLLSNAIKFTPDGGQIQVSLAHDRGSARIMVIDSGDGIDAEFLPHLFEPFRQADTGSTRRYGGLGLGLAIVRQLVELHGGSVSGGSAGPQGGARFTVLLPLGSDKARPGQLSDTQH